MVPRYDPLALLLALLFHSEERQGETPPLRMSKGARVPKVGAS